MTVYTIMAYTYNYKDEFCIHDMRVVGTFTDQNVATRIAQSLTLKSQAKNEDGAYEHFSVIGNELDCGIAVELFS